MTYNINLFWFERGRTLKHSPIESVYVEAEEIIGIMNFRQKQE